MCIKEWMKYPIQPVETFVCDQVYWCFLFYILCRTTPRQCVCLWVNRCGRLITARLMTLTSARPMWTLWSAPKTFRNINTLTLLTHCFINEAEEKCHSQSWFTTINSIVSFTVSVMTSYPLIRRYIFFTFQCDCLEGDSVIYSAIFNFNSVIKRSWETPMLHKFFIFLWLIYPDIYSFQGK